MGTSWAGLASTMQGYDQSERQRVVDEANKRRAEQEKWDYENKKREADLERQRREFETGGGLGDAEPKLKTRGDAIVDSIKGMLGMGEQHPPGTPTQQPAQQVGLGTVAQPQTPAQPVSKVLMDRANAYREKYPNDVDGYLAMKAKAGAAYQQEAAADHADFVSRGEDALRRFIASHGMDTSGIDDVATKYWPNGHAYSTKRNADGSYTVTETSTGQTKNLTYDQLGSMFSNLLHADTYMAAHAKAQEAGMVEAAKLPSKVSEEREKAKAKGEADIRTADATGVTGKNRADANQSNAAAGLSSANAEEKQLEVKRKRALADVNAELANVDEVEEPSRYKELMRKRKSLEAEHANAGGLDAAISEREDGTKVPVITDPVTGKVYQDGNVIYDRNANSSGKPPPAPAKVIQTLPKGAVQIGTSGGKPVFETPDGIRFIGN